MVKNLKIVKNGKNTENLKKSWKITFFFFIFFIFFPFFGIPFKVTKVTTKCYHGYYWTPKIAKNGPKLHNKLFFSPKGNKSIGRSPPQELEVGPRSGPYLLVLINWGFLVTCSFQPYPATIISGDHTSTAVQYLWRSIHSRMPRDDISGTCTSWQKAFIVGCSLLLQSDILNVNILQERSKKCIKGKTIKKKL